MRNVISNISKIVKNTKFNEVIAPYTYFKIGGCVKALTIPQDDLELKKLLEFLEEHSQSFFVLGAGTNLLVSDRGYNGVVIKLGKEFDFIDVEENRLRVGALTMLSDLLSRSLAESLSGLEYSWGIPGTVGGAIKMNAGAWEFSFSQLVQSIVGYKSDGTKVKYHPHAGDWDYRVFHPILITVFTEAELEFKEADPDEMGKLVSEVQAYRRGTQPLEYPSAGCVFKNPENISAGELIDKMGFKGTCIGGAQISTKHANFIINTGNARAEEVLQLIELIQEKAWKEHSIKLETEIIKLGVF
ncbi:UDP-N-acetylmuramate dehydrogenase [bacterium]|nr:UDP-N-acetylmuramate dehydrogenase [bacterium]